MASPMTAKVDIIAVKHQPLHFIQKIQRILSLKLLFRSLPFQLFAIILIQQEFSYIHQINNL